MIPRIIYFCNKNIDDKMINYANNWKKLNENYNIILYDDEMCRKFLLEEWGELYLNIFDFIVDGPIKADFWRLCILYKYGGVYSDIDNEPLLSFNEFIENDVNFVTCSSFWDEKHFIYNPNLIFSESGSIILKECIDWYVFHYNNKTPYSYWEWSVMRCFTEKLKLKNYYREDGIYRLISDENIKVQIIKEVQGNNHYDAHNIYSGKRVFNNRYEAWDSDLHKFKG